MEVTRIDQVAIAVEDLDRALEFFRRAFGLEAQHREVVESDGVEEAMLWVGDTAIQLLEATREDSPIARFIARRGPGLHHIGLAVRDLRAALDHLKAEGIQLIDEEPRPGGGGHLVAFVHPKATGGVLVELIEERR